MNSKVSHSVLDAIGNTNLYQIKHIAEPGSANIFAKCEFKNPTGSHKDRVFNYIINELEACGVIKPGMTLVDCSTGNGGAALAQIGSLKGYKVVIFMPAGMTIERKTQIQSFGAEIIETPSNAFLEYAEQKAHEYVREHPNSYFLDQSSNQLNWRAWCQCGVEIVEYFRALDQKVDLFVCSIGTGGTFSGIAEQLKAAFPNMKTVAVEVEQSAPLYAKLHRQEFVHSPHNLMGLGPGKIAKNLREDLVDDVEMVSGDDSWNMMKKLIREEKLFVGPTAGSNMFVTQKYARTLGLDKNIVTVLFDSAWKYFSIWDGKYTEYESHRTIV
ncbi:cysteine synthase family protein [Chlorogloeopsis sp. ULAP01]|uniref:PLP-dependent cysteine synthase family protein n=1 Tax=Chlorogloeopsis sp. ULAP01 TaxID=3056483 RepID=UPI0025AB313D|nr:cysteine synthase family protein [Chlorogloeopsis sp. ULAP01]MDM9382029.1 cysteine synthase family protein [Chlorogloeopsis sp. ULAP01]